MLSDYAQTFAIEILVKSIKCTRFGQPSRFANAAG